MIRNMIQFRMTDTIYLEGSLQETIDSVHAFYVNVTEIVGVLVLL